LNFVYSKAAQKSIKSINEPNRSRIKYGIEHLPLGDIKKIQGYDDMFRLRIGDYRVLFYIDDETFFIAEILPRGTVYKRI
jgi:mRNA interferase RelE/StbE